MIGPNRPAVRAAKSIRSVRQGKSKRRLRDVGEANDSESRPAGRRFSPWRLLPVAVVAAGFAAIYASGLHEYLSFEMLRDHRQTLLAWRSEHYAVVAVAFVALYCLMVALSVPGAVWMTIAGGFLFGALEATLYSVAGATAGAVLIFLAARYAIGDYLLARAGSAVRKMEDGFRENALSYLLVLRLVPIFPFWLVNLVPAFLGVSLGVYVVGTFLGIIPGGFVYATVGSGLGAILEAGEEPDLGIIFEPAILLPIAGLVVLSLIPIVYSRYKKGGAQVNGGR